MLDLFSVPAIRLLIMTGVRLREILQARWQEVDFERGALFLPDSKTGRKPIYLSSAAQAVLEELPRLEGNPHIIPGGAKEGQPCADLEKPWAAVTKAAGLDGLRIHDLRHSFASVGAGQSPPQPDLPSRVEFFRCRAVRTEVKLWKYRDINHLDENHIGRNQI